MTHHLRYATALLLGLAAGTPALAQSPYLSDLTPLEPATGHYAELGTLSAAPSSATDPADTLLYPPELYSNSTLLYALARPHYLSEAQADYLFTAVQPPATSSEQTRAELVYLHELEAARTPAQEARVLELARIGYWPDAARLPTHPSYGRQQEHLMYVCREAAAAALLRRHDAAAAQGDSVAELRERAHALGLPTGAGPGRGGAGATGRALSARAGDRRVARGDGRALPQRRGGRAAAGPPGPAADVAHDRLPARPCGGARGVGGGSKCATAHDAAMTGPSEHSPRPPRLDDETYARLLAWLQQRGADEDVARDILHEALVRFARYRPGLVYSGAELSYLRRVMGSCLLDHLTGQRREREAVGELARATWAEAAAGGAHEDVRLSMATWVRARVDELPPELRDAVVSVDLGGESQRDYAGRGRRALRTGPHGRGGHRARRGGSPPTAQRIGPPGLAASRTPRGPRGEPSEHGQFRARRTRAPDGGFRQNPLRRPRLRCPLRRRVTSPRLPKP